MSAQNCQKEIIERIQTALAQEQPLRIRGNGSKDFYGGLLAGALLDISRHQGIVAYEPTEFYLTARAGTSLAEIESLLADQRQMLAFEPPSFGGATLGGCVASGLSGPRRMQAGAVRDFVLGVSLIDGRGQVLRFGGQVMKNVAGYDVSRLMAGSLGCLGVMSEITVKLLPQPPAEATLLFECEQGRAISLMNAWGAQPLPISATFWFDGQLWLRLSGAHAAVASARQRLGGELQGEGSIFWQAIKEQKHPAFAATSLWRVAVPSKTAPLAHRGMRAIEWGGGVRWFAGEEEVEDGALLREQVWQAGGHVTLFRAPESVRCREGTFSPLSPGLLALHRRLKNVFDPQGIFNPGRMYAEL